MKKVYVLVNALLFLLIGYTALAQISTKEIDEGLAKMVISMNEKGPVKLDKLTRLDSVGSLPGRVIVYNYTLLYPPKANVDYDALQKTMRLSLINMVKENPQMQIFRENDIVMIYHYYKDETKKEIFTIEIKPKDYK